MSETPSPAPGSADAIEQGCTCPVLDNRYGDGWLGADRHVIAFDCPLHGGDDA